MCNDILQNVKATSVHLPIYVGQHIYIVILIYFQSTRVCDASGILCDHWTIAINNNDHVNI